MKKKKVLITALIILIIAALAGGGIWFWQKNRKGNVVEVIPVENLNGSDFVEFGTELTGAISSDYVQEVIPDGSKDIKKIYVKKGQKVKKGDKLLKYDVEEQELDVQLQKLQIDSAKLRIANMEKELQKLKNTKPVGSVDGSAAPMLSASIGLPGIGSTIFRSVLEGNGTGILVAEETDESDGTGSSGDGSDSSSAAESGESTTESGESTAESSESTTESGESTTETTDADLSEAKATAIQTIKDAMTDYSSSEYQAVDGQLETDVLNTYSEKINAAKTKEDIDAARKEAVNKLKEIAGLAAKRDAAKQELDAYVADKKYGKADTDKETRILSEAEGSINTAKSEGEIREIKESALNNLKALEGGPLYTFIDDENEQQASNSGSGSTAQTTIRFLLVKDGNAEPTISGDVVYKLFNDSQFAGKYIEFRVYNSESDFPKGTPSRILQLTPDSELKGTVDQSRNYTVPEIENQIRQKTPPVKTEYLLKSLTKYTQHQSGKGTLKSKYRYNLKKNALITGSVIKNLISKKKYAIIRDYESDDAFAAGDNPLNTITITPDTRFSETISGTAKYTIRDLNKLLITVKSIKVSPKKKGLKTVNTGGKYAFKATVSGSNIKTLDVIWSVTGAKSKFTSISSKGILTVGSDEKSAALKVTAKAGTKKGSYLVKVKRTKSSSGNDSDPDLPDSDGRDDSDFPGGSDGGTDTYTAEELKDAISEKELEIAEAKQDLNEAKINYKEAKKEVDAATVKAAISGTVTTAYTVKDAPVDSAAVVVRADEGMYVKTAVSEMDLDTVKVGGTILCTSYETGESYQAEVREVSDFPTDDNSSVYSGNPNNSYYPVTAYIAEAEGLRIGESVTITYDSESMGTISGDSVYLPVAYVRTEGNRSYVYKADKDGKLKKSYVKTGKSVSGQFIEITAGVTMDDKLAFPYGKNVKDGAKTKVPENPEDYIVY